MDFLIIPALVQGVFKLTLAVAAILAVRGTLLWMDRRFSINFFGALREAHPNAQIAYFAVRLLAISLLVGLVLS